MYVWLVLLFDVYRCSGFGRSYDSDLRARCNAGTEISLSLREWMVETHMLFQVLRYFRRTS